MKTKIISEQNMDQAASIIRNGGLVVFPTETVYGLGASAFLPDAAVKIYNAKGRPSDNPLIVHIADISQLSQCMKGENYMACKLLEKFAPGPLTVIVKKNKDISETVTASLNTVGIRIPSHPVARKFLKACNVPVAAPSANISGKPSPTNFKMACSNMMDKVDAIIESTASQHGLESTIIDCTCSGSIAVLRPGSITIEMIKSVVPENIIIKQKESDGKIIKAPGMKYTHYKPLSDICLFNSDNIMNLKKKLGSGCDLNHILVIGVTDNIDAIKNIKKRKFKNLTDYAASLFLTFHEADELGIDTIYAEYPEKKHIGIALRNRLEKASSGNFLK